MRRVILTAQYGRQQIPKRVRFASSAFVSVRFLEFMTPGVIEAAAPEDGRGPGAPLRDAEPEQDLTGNDAKFALDGNAIGMGLRS